MRRANQWSRATADGTPATATDFYRQRLLNDISLSPDGERLAYVVREIDAEREWQQSLWVRPTDCSAEPRRLTRQSHAKSPLWSSDGSGLGFVGRRQPDAALERYGCDGTPAEGTQVWAFDMDRGGDARQVTNFERGVWSFDWGPEGDWMVVEAPDPDVEPREDDAPIEVERGQYNHRVRGGAPARRHLFVVDTETRAARRLDAAHTGGSWEPYESLDPAVNPDGDRIAFVSNPDGGDHSNVLDAYTIRPDGTDLVRLTDGTRHVLGVAWSPEGRRLAVHSRNPENFAEPQSVSVVDPDGSVRSLTDGLDRRVEDVVWERPDALLALVADAGRITLQRFHLDGRIERLPWGLDETATLTSGGYESVARLDVAEKVVAACPSAPDRAPEVAVTSTFNLATDEGPEPTQLTRANEAFEESRRLPAVTRIAYESDDGTEIEGYLLYPPGERVEALSERPVHVRVHDGLERFASPAFDFADVFWIGQGYVVFHPLERGSTSYGQAFAEAGMTDWGDRPVTDILAGVEALLDRGIADPERLFVSGFSRGATVTAFALAESDRFAAAALERGVYDYESAYGAYAMGNWHETHLGLPSQNPELHEKMSPLETVDRIETPTLVSASERDEWAPPDQAQMLYGRLDRRGVPTKLLVYPEENHAVLTPEYVTRGFEARREWFERHTEEE